MKNFLSVVAFCLCALAQGQTQYNMNEQAAVAYKKADEALNRVYRQVLREYAADSVFIDHLKTAQRLWIRFRDAEVKMKYPADPVQYGSVFSICALNYLEELTLERTATLNRWLDGMQEGDVCTGSQKIR